MKRSEASHPAHLQRDSNERYRADLSRDFVNIKIHRPEIKRRSSQPAFLDHPLLRWAFKKVLTTAESQISVEYCYRCEVLLEGDTSRLEPPLLCEPCGQEVFSHHSTEDGMQPGDSRSKNPRIRPSHDFLNRYSIIESTGVDPVRASGVRLPEQVGSNSSEVPFCIFTGKFIGEESFLVGPFKAPASVARRLLRGQIDELDEIANGMILPFLSLYNLHPGQMQLEIHWGSRISKNAASHPRYQKFAYVINPGLRILKIEIDLSDGAPNYYEFMLALVSLIGCFCNDKEIDRYGDPSSNDLLIYLEAELVFAFSANTKSMERYAKQFLPKHRRNRIRDTYMEAIRSRRPRS
ncbi:MAG: hypothetical protein RH862_04705 [Leptospiraceae bacterium]